MDQNAGLRKGKKKKGKKGNKQKVKQVIRFVFGTKRKRNETPLKETKEKEMEGKTSQRQVVVREV